MTLCFTAIPDDDVLAIGLLVTTDPNNAPDLRAWAREAHNLLTTIANLPEIHDSTPDVMAEAQPITRPPRAWIEHQAPVPTPRLQQPCYHRRRVAVPTNA